MCQMLWTVPGIAYAEPILVTMTEISISGGGSGLGGGSQAQDCSKLYLYKVIANLHFTDGKTEALGVCLVLGDM